MSNVFQPQNSSIMRISIKNIPFYLLCLTIPFENTALSFIGGVFTAPLPIIFIPLFLVYILLNVRNLQPEAFLLLKVFSFFVVYSLMMVFFYIGKYDVGFLTDRGIRLILMEIPSIVIFIIITMQNQRALDRGVFIIFSVVIITFLLNLIIPELFNNKSIIQGTAALSPDRMRGLTFEASMFGFQFVLAALLFVSAIKSNTLISYFLIIMACIAITSKGTIIGLILSIAIGIAFFSKTSLPIKIITGGLLGVISFLILNILLSGDFATDLDKYSSVATRSSVILTSIFSLFPNPFGSGFFGYLPAFYENGIQVFNYMTSLFPSLNYNELLGLLIIGTTDGVSTKSFFFDWLIYGGILFLYLYIRFVSFIIKKQLVNHHKNEFVIFVFLIIASTFYIPIGLHYIAAFALGYIYSKIKNSNNI